MTATVIWLAAGVALAALLCAWAWLTGGPGEDVSKVPARQVARHSKAIQGEVTTRLRPAAPELDGGQAQFLPRREDLPWNQ